MMMKSLLAFACPILALSAYAAGFTVDFACEKGKVRRLNGVNGTARMNNICNPTADMLPAFRELEIPLTHLHDIPLANPGYMLVDVSRIFPLFHADENDPRNYDFGPTDLYVRRVRETGSEVMFRLGESIEHCGRPFRARPPADMEKWTRICLNIIRHYNEGWADGFRWNVRKWCVWEEPNGSKTFSTEHPIEDYCRLYATFAKAAKAAFPDIEVGGPTTGIGGKVGPWQEKFVGYCRENGVPLDFFSFTAYCWAPTAFAQYVRDVRKLLDGAGYTKTKIVCTEWHLAPRDWKAMQGARTPEMMKKERDTLKGADSAAYAAGVLAHLQDTPADELCYYSATLGCWALVDGLRRLPGWYVFKAFATLAAKGEATRIDAPSNVGHELYLLASKHGGRGYALVTSFCRMWPVSLTVRNAGRPTRVLVIDEMHDLEPLDGKWWTWDAKAGTVSLKPGAGCASTVWLVEFDLNATTGADDPAPAAQPVREEINGN